MTPQDEKRFWDKIRKTETCWIWEAGKNKDGYGYFSLAGKNLRAHRVLWEMINGPIQIGAVLCHECDNRACVNPEHLWVGSDQSNASDMVRKGRSFRPTGLLNNNAKITPAKVRKMRALRGSGVLLREIAKTFNVSVSLVSLIVRRLSWTSIQ